MDLPIPIISGGKIYHALSIKKPTPGVIADTKQDGEESYYHAVQTFIQGCVTEIHGADGAVHTDRNFIKPLIALLPWRSAVYVAIKVMSLMSEDDGIEGVYECPRCQKQTIAEANHRAGLDTRDFIKNFPLTIMDPKVYKERYAVELEEPVRLKVGEETLELSRFEFRWPNLSDCIRAAARVGVKDEIRLQLNIYAEAMVSVNGEEIEPKFKITYGSWIMENLPDVIRDVNAINEPQEQYGLDPRAQKTCKGCGKTWKALVNTSNFFVSGLQRV